MRLEPRAQAPRQLAEAPLEELGRIAAGVLAPVDRRDRHHLANGRRREHLVGGEKPVEWVAARLHLVLLAGEGEQRRPRLARQDAELEARREQTVALAPPDVRHGAFEHRSVEVDEHGIVRPAALRLRLGRDVRRVAHRLRPREEPRRRAPRVGERHESVTPGARGFDPLGDGEDERDRGRLPAGCPRASSRRGARRRRGPRRPPPPPRARQPTPRPAPADRGEPRSPPVARGALGGGTAARRRRAWSRTRLVPARSPRRRPPRRRSPARRHRAPRPPQPAAARRSSATARDAVAGATCAPRRATRPSGAPMASRSGAAFVSDSCTSPRGSESHTMPPPTQRCTHPPATANVRIVSASSRSPFPYTRPSAPIDAPRPTGSRPAMRSTAAIFGAPVTDPPGKTASSSSASPTSGRSRPSTVDTRCSTPASGSATMRSGQCTLPATQTRDRSLRSRSTIITCSAASFADARSSARPPVGRVPLIGRVHTRRPRRARKSSGEAETIAQPRPSRRRHSSSRNGQWLGCVRWPSRAESALGRPEMGAERCCTRLTW